MSGVRRQLHFEQPDNTFSKNILHKEIQRLQLHSKISEQLHHNDDLYEQQRTLRLTYPTFRRNPSIERPEHTEQSNEDISETMFDLAGQNQLKKQALDRATLIIEYLTEQNNGLRQEVAALRDKYAQVSEELSKAQKELKRAEQRDLQQKSTKNESMLGGSLIARFTPLKICSRQQEQTNYLAPLSQIQKVIISDRIYQIQDELQDLHQLTSIEKQQLDDLKNQQAYMNAYIQDHLSAVPRIQSLPRLVTKQEYEQQLQRYQACIRRWQKYACSLKISLMESLQFIQELNQSEQQQPWKDDLDDLASYISRKVVRLLQQKQEKTINENRQLRILVEQLINKFKEQQVV